MNSVTQLQQALGQQLQQLQLQGLLCLLQSDSVRDPRM